MLRSTRSIYSTAWAVATTKAYTNLLDEVKGVSAASRVAAKEADGGGPTAKRAKR